MGRLVLIILGLWFVHNLVSMYGIGSLIGAVFAVIVFGVIFGAFSLGGYALIRGFKVIWRD